MIKLACFDLDGVLVDLCETHRVALNMALKQLANYEIPYEEHVSTYNGLPTKTKLRMLQDRGVVLNAQNVEELKQYYTKVAIQASLKEDREKREMLRWIKSKNISICCVSNSISETIFCALSHANIAEYFDLIISNEMIKNPKPSPEPYELAIRNFSLPVEQVAIFEDSPVGLRSAHATGAHVIECTFEILNKEFAKGKIECL
jgi:beta-phosphoglucomutase